MGSIHKFSSQVIDYAERLSEMADAAHGKRRHRGLGMRWLVLPASGAAAYALVRSKSFSRQAKEVVDEAKTRASELPTDLVARVRQATASTEASSSSSGQNGSGRSTGQRTRSSGTRKTSSARGSRSTKSAKSRSGSASSSR